MSDGKSEFDRLRAEASNYAEIAIRERAAYEGIGPVSLADLRREIQVAWLVGADIHWRLLKDGR